MYVGYHNISTVVMFFYESVQNHVVVIAFIKQESIPMIRLHLRIPDVSDPGSTD